MRVLSLIVVLLVSTPAFADDPPWAAGVSEAEQAAALALYDQGNAEFQNARFQQAVDLYKQAIAHWDHPAIRFNMAVCYNNLGQLLEAEDNLERGMKYGEDPLGHDLYAQGLNYRELLGNRLARIQISCKEPNTQVSLDGHVVFTAPGEIEEFVLPGEHQVVATKPGFQTASETLQLGAGQARLHEVRLIALKQQVNVVRRWAPWKPWAVVAAGALVVGVGAFASHEASLDFAAYDAGVTARCPHGCDGPTLASFGDLDSTRHHGDIDRALGTVAFVTGGAAIVAGLVGVLLDQPHAENIAPVPLPGGAAVTARWRF